MSYVKIYFGETREGKWNINDEVSEYPSQAKAIEFKLRSDLNESDKVRLYAMTEEGYLLSDAEVSIEGEENSSKNRWSLAPDIDGVEGTYLEAGVNLSLNEISVDTGKVFFWAKATANDTETPIIDVSVSLKLSGVASIATPSEVN